jgi:hypothetical protein
MSDLTTATGIELDKATTTAIVGHMLKNRAFTDKCMTKLKPGQFAGMLAEIVRAIFDICSNERYNEVVLNRSVVHSHLLNSGNIKDSFAYQNQLLECERMADPQQGGHDLAIVASYLEGWMAKLVAIDYTNKLTKMVNNSEYQKIIPHITSMNDAAADLSFKNEADVSSNFKGIYDSFIVQAQEKNDRNTTTGHPLFDELLSEGSLIPEGQDFNFKGYFDNNSSIVGIGEQLSRQTRGGFNPGGSTALLGTVNSGKTTTICTIAAANALLNKQVCLVTLEQDAKEIRDKIISNILNKSSHEIQLLCLKVKALGGPIEAAKADPEMYAFLYAMACAEKITSENIVHIHHNKAGQMTLEHVQWLLNNAIQDKKRKTGGGFDLVIVDYPGRLRSEKFGKNGQRHDELTMIYQHFIALASQHKYHTILPVQTNRDGYKTNQGTQGGGRMLDMGDTAGAFGIAQAADMVISINRTPQDKAQDTIRFMITKNRGGATEKVFASKTNMAKSQAFGIFLPAVTFNYTQNIDQNLVARWIGESAMTGKSQDKRSEQSMDDLRDKLDQMQNDPKSKEQFEQRLAELMPPEKKPDGLI